MSSRGHSQDRALSQERETAFAGYGDRVGSGVAYAPAQWRGGELVTDPSMVTKSLKTRRFYYSPIGDGVVAADGVELKRLPPDLTPKVEVIQQRVVERAPPGKPGLRVTEKTWSTGGGESDSNLAYGSKQMGAASPTADGQRQLQRPETDPFSKPTDQLGSPYQRPESAQSMPANNRNGAPKDQWMSPRDHGIGGPKDGGLGGPPSAGRHGPFGGDGNFGPGVGGPHGSTRSTPGLGPATNGTGNFGPEFPTSGRSSAYFWVSLADLYEPGYRYEIKKDYKVTNPRELIHQYATGTPVTAIDPNLTETTRTITRQHYTQTVEESFGPFPPYTAGPNVPTPLKFARELRDETMTNTQRQANMQKDSLGASAKDAQFEQRISEIRHSTNRQISPHNQFTENFTGI
uniref:Uncharacterized protein n=1 Tax=Meloidogyne javanica TaxID=6303 RepID=A0A915N367_MELJA